MKFTGNNHSPKLMTWLDVGGERSRLHLGLSTWWWRYPCRSWGVKIYLL